MPSLSVTRSVTDDAARPPPGARSGSRRTSQSGSSPAAAAPSLSIHDRDRVCCSITVVDRDWRPNGSGGSAGAAMTPAWAGPGSCSDAAPMRVIQCADGTSVQEAVTKVRESCRGRSAVSGASASCPVSGDPDDPLEIVRIAEVRAHRHRRSAHRSTRHSSARNDSPRVSRPRSRPRHDDSGSFVWESGRRR